MLFHSLFFSHLEFLAGLRLPRLGTIRLVRKIRVMVKGVYWDPTKRWDSVRVVWSERRKVVLPSRWSLLNVEVKKARRKGRIFVRRNSARCLVKHVSVVRRE